MNVLSRFVNPAQSSREQNAVLRKLLEFRRYLVCKLINYSLSRAYTMEYEYTAADRQLYLLVRSITD